MECTGDKPQPEDDRGVKIDYLLVGEDVYLVELKTTAGSIKAKQANRYLKLCCNQDKQPMTFGEVFGEKLLRILGKHYTTTDWQSLDTLRENFFTLVNDRREEITCEEKAKEYLKCNNKASTFKYLYTIGQILDFCPDSTSLKTLWGKELRLIYITPNGEPLPKELSKCNSFYIWPKQPEHLESICLKNAVPKLEPEKDRGEYLQLLQAIVKEIYKVTEGK